MKSRLVAVAWVWTVALALTLFTSASNAREVVVKYRDAPVDVDNGHFVEIELTPSSLVKEMFYDSENKYLLVSLKGTFYHYCSIPKHVVAEWVADPSLGQYYNLRIKGHFDCRVNPVPRY